MLIAPKSLLLALGLAPLQGNGSSTSACNHQTRHVTTQGGNYSTGSQSCPSFSFTLSIGGQSISFSTPSECDTGRREQSFDCFDCGPASSGNHCTGHGFQVNVKIYSAGGGSPCPSLPNTLPTTAAAANAAVSCKPLPMISDTQMWCASVSSCATGALESSYCEGETLADVDGVKAFHGGDPAVLLPPPIVDPLDDWLRARQTAPVEALPSLLADVLASHPAVAGVGDVTADVVLMFAEVDGHDGVRNSYRVDGAFGAAGRFRVQNPRRALDDEGGSVPLIEELAFDGASFFRGVAGAPCYDVWGSSSTARDRAMQVNGAYLSALRTWVDDPFRVLLFPGTAYHVDASTSPATVTESYPQVELPDGAGQTIYSIDLSTGVPHPVRIDVVDDAGSLVWRRTFGDYRRLAPDVWRPFTLADEQYDAGATTPFLVTSVRIHAARPLDAGELARELAPPRSSENWWFVRL